jgi:N-acetyl-gamma-glutamyl-phosphate reductase
VVRVAIVGATGYAGVEALRLLAQHPAARVTYLASHSQAGQRIGDVYPHLGPAGEAPLRPVDVEAIAAEADVALLSLPARQGLELAPQLLRRGVRVIDFGADFRLKDAEAYARYYGGPHTAPELLREAVYGLTEFHRAEVAGARLVANPGCYPTAALFALWPALAAGVVLPEDIIVDAKSGVSGAGRQPTPTGHLPEADDNVFPYKIAGEHRHTPEMEQELSLAAGRPVRVSFSPHQVPMSRGLVATCYARLGRELDTAAVQALYREAYAGEPFVQVLERGLPSTKATMGSNAVHVAVRADLRAGRLVAVAAIDNLGKGAAGQAVQNLNRMFGLDETAGLPRVGLYP